MSDRLSKVPPEWGKPPNFFFGNREKFKEMAESTVYTRWLRVVWAAYSRFEANGHAVFRQTELAGILSDEEPLPGGGFIRVPATRQRVREAINIAIERELLEPESKALCLVVPRDAVAYGMGKNKPCPRHPVQRNDETVSPRQQTTGLNRVVSTPKERRNRVVSGSAPLLSLPNCEMTDDRGIA